MTMPIPNRDVVIVLDHSHESRVLLSEYQREWELTPLRWDCQARFRIHFVEYWARPCPIQKCPAIIVNNQSPQYLESTAASGEALRSLHKILRTDSEAYREKVNPDREFVKQEFSDWTLDPDVGKDLSKGLRVDDSSDCGP